MKLLFVYPRFERHANSHPELRTYVPMNEYLGSPSLGIAAVAAVTPPDWEISYRDDRLSPADELPTDADIVALSFFTPAASRALELADHFRAQGVTVVAGGIFPTMMPDVVQPHVDAVVVGEGEEVWPRLLEDWRRGELKPRYVPGPCNLESVPAPRTSIYIDHEVEGVFEPDDYPLQLSRGCPLTCRACALPEVMGRTLRPFPEATIYAQLDALEKHGKHACLTEDTSWLPGVGRRRLSALFDHLIERGRRAMVSYVGTSFPMIAATTPRFMDKAKSAGVDMFYLVTGFDPISVRAFTGKHPKARARAAAAVARCFDAGIEPYASFLYGADQDDEGTVDRVLEFCNETGIRKAEFAISTPYPNTPEWHRFVSEDRILTREWSKYNDANIVFQPAQLTPDQVVEGYLRLWREFYAPRTDVVAGFTEYERTIQF